jgi:hypothetical protein
MDIVITSVISGIHKTKIGANRHVELRVENDNTIPDIDSNCMAVWVPSIEDIPPELHQAIAYPKSRNPKDPRQRDQLVSETAGRKVGNVPSNLCGVLRRLKEKHLVKKISW